ncbi:MAG: LptF/LptG family permease [Phycisphaeraceae bacterium]
MLLTLHRYILRELLKLLAASSAVLVVVMAFGFSIGPISEGLLGPAQMLRVIVYTIPGMLLFALPFAAAFASTLLFFRMAADNEITACAATGVSYRSLLAPVLIVGLLLTGSLFWLSNWVVPHFWRVVSQEVEQDVAEMVVRQIQRREVVRLGRLLLYADVAHSNVPINEDIPEGSLRPYNRLVLDGVAVGRMSRDGGMAGGDGAAERAEVNLYREDERDRVYATLRLINVTYNDPETGRLVFNERASVRAQEIPLPFSQEPKFMSLPQLRNLVQQPELSSSVRGKKSDLVEALAVHHLLEQLQQELIEHDELELDTGRGERHQLRNVVGQIQGSDLNLEPRSGETFNVRTRSGGLISQQLDARSGRLEVSDDELAEELRINLVLERVTVRDRTLPGSSTLREVTLPLLRFDATVMADLRTADVAELMTLSEGHAASDVVAARAALSEQVLDLLRDITSRMHERGAIAVNCALVLMLGAVMAMLLRNQVPLTIFFWCFVPAVLVFLGITTGQNMIQSLRFPIQWGIMMTWAGNAILAATVVGVYWRLSRN